MNVKHFSSDGGGKERLPDTGETASPDRIDTPHKAGVAPDPENKNSHAGIKRYGPWILLVAIIGVVVGVIATQGNSKNPGKSNSNSFKEVSIGIPLKNITALPIWVARLNGYFTQHHLKVQSPIMSATITTTALLGNSVQFISDNASTFLSARARNSPIIAVSQWDNGTPVALLLSRQFAKDHDITAATPLSVVMKAIPGSLGGSSSPTTTGQATVLFKSYGIKPSQIRVATFSTVTAVETAIQRNSVDWMCTAEPTPFELEAKGFGIVVASSANASAWRVPTLNQILVTSNSYAIANPSTVREFAAAINEATKFISLHSQLAAVIAKMNITDVSDAIMVKSLSSLVWPQSGTMSSSIWNSTISFNVRAGIIPPGTAVKQEVDWTNKFLAR